MKQKLFTLAMIIAILSLPFSINAKGKYDGVSAALLKDGNGVTIGRVIGMETVSWPYVLTNQGYRTLFRVGTGMIYAESTVYYGTADCTDQAYVAIRSPGTVFMPTLNDLTAYAAGALFYSPNDAQSVIINTSSVLDADLNCSPYTSNREVYPAYPNDPNITGIQNTAYPTRMLIE